MKRLMKIILKITDIQLPTICFFIMFLVFIVSIFFRYVLNNPIMVSEEISTICYIYITFLMAPYIYKINAFVRFNLVIDRLNEKWQMIFRLMGNIMIFIIFILLLRPTWIFFNTLRTYTPVLQVPWTVMFWPYLYMIILMIFRSLYKIYQDVELILKRKRSISSKKISEVIEL